MVFSRQRARWVWFGRKIITGLTTRPLTPAGKSSGRQASPLGRGLFLVPQVEAFEKETDELNFTDTYLTSGTLFFGDVVWAVSLRADCGSDWGVDKSGCK